MYIYLYIQYYLLYSRDIALFIQSFQYFDLQ